MKIVNLISIGLKYLIDLTFNNLCRKDSPLKVDRIG